MLEESIFVPIRNITPCLIIVICCSPAVTMTHHRFDLHPWYMKEYLKLTTVRLIYPLKSKDTFNDMSLNLSIQVGRLVGLLKLAHL